MLTSLWKATCEMSIEYSRNLQRIFGRRKFAAVDGIMLVIVRRVNCILKYCRRVSSEI